MTKVIDLNFYRKSKQVLDLDESENLTEKRIEQIEAQIKSKPSKSFEEIIKKNKENEERLKKERMQDNKKVKKSYRIE
jgi:Cu2+-containing amine oxidase